MRRGKEALAKNDSRTSMRPLIKYRFVVMVLGLEVITPHGLDELNYYKYSGTDR